MRTNKPPEPSYFPPDIDWAALAPLPREFYLQPTVKVARALLGTVLIHRTKAGLTAGRIVETEAYLVGDAGSHANRGRTRRNDPMFGTPGIFYVYLIYGVHYCMNVVTQPEGVPEAVLIRALEPLAGLELMRERRGRHAVKELCAGPAKLTAAVGVGLAQNRAEATRPPLWIAAGPPGRIQVAVGPRVGLSAHQNAAAPLRFGLAGSSFLSRKIARPSRAG